MRCDGVYECHGPAERRVDANGIDRGCGSDERVVGGTVFNFLDLPTAIIDWKQKYCTGLLGLRSKIDSKDPHTGFSRTTGINDQREASRFACTLITIVAQAEVADGRSTAGHMEGSLYVR